MVTRRLNFFYLVLAALTLLWLWPTQPAGAHAAFVSANPAPNSVLPEHAHQITVWFTEPLEPAFSEIQVFNTQGQQVDSGDSQVHADDPTAMSVSLPTLPDGTYTVAWRNVSTVDGHALRGSFVISFGQPLTGAEGAGETTEATDQSSLDPLARGLVLVGGLTAVGGLAFEILLLIPVFFAPGSTALVAALGSRLLRRSRRLAWLALLLFAAGSVFQLLLQTTTFYNSPLSSLAWMNVMTVLRTTDWGNLWVWRLWLIVVVTGGLAAAALLGGAEDSREEEALSVRLARLVALLAGLGALLTLSLTSHAAALVELRAAALFSDYLHLLAAALWVGGLFHLALAARPLYRELAGSQRRALLATLVPRFSTLAMLSVGTLIITGLYSTWAQVTILPAFVTPYGLTLLAKLLLFLPMLGLGAVNLLWTGRRLQQEERADTWLRRAVSGEALLGLLILLIVALLTTLEPARQVASWEGLGQEQALTFQETVERTTISLTVEPALAGNNRFLIELRDPQGRPITNATEVVLNLTYLDAELGEISQVARPGEPGQYIVDDLLLSVGGGWQAAVQVRRPDAFDAHTAFRFNVRAGTDLALSTQAGTILWGIELVLLGILFLGSSLPLGSWRTRPGLAVAAPGALALLAGLVLALGSPLLFAASEQPLRNPFPPTAESIAAGETLYTQNCQTCHGPAGLGDGPLAENLTPPPANLVVHVPLHPDADLYTVIHHGVPGTPMPAFGEQLTEEEIWHLINFLRTLE